MAMIDTTAVSKETVLIVDDSSDNLRLLSTMLQSQGYQVKKAISGKFALQSLTVIEPDLILLDVHMPEMDGYQVCQTLKANPHYQGIPVIFISAADQLFNKVQAFQAGAVDYITKPFHLEEVLIRVENQLNQKRLYRELEKQNILLKAEITERRKAEEALTQANHRLEELAAKDGLTGLANRRHLDRYLTLQWRSALLNRQSLALILIDVDFFKAYNDAYGHLLGDDCLKQVATILQSMSRKQSDLVARYGGEEFVVVLPNTTVEEAKQLAQRIQTAIAEQKIPHRQSQVASHITLSMGLTSLVPEETKTAATLIQTADLALYQAKTRGRNRIICH
ncbi:MAG: diguanylate cyclase domain-containing protein [Synechocystis sp.]